MLILISNLTGVAQQGLNLCFQHLVVGDSDIDSNNLCYVRVKKESRLINADVSGLEKPDITVVMLSRLLLVYFSFL